MDMFAVSEQVSTNVSITASNDKPQEGPEAGAPKSYQWADDITGVG